MELDRNENMTEPALDTTFDASLIDLSQHTPNPTQSFSTTESITSLDCNVQDAGDPQEPSESSTNNWVEAIAEAISEILPDFAVQATSLTSSTAENIGVTINVALFVAGMQSDDNLRRIVGDLERHNFQEPEITMRYHIVKFKDWNQGHPRVPEMVKEEYHGAIVVIEQDGNNDLKQYARFMESMLCKNSILILCELHSSKDQCEHIHFFEETGFSLMKHVITKVVENDTQALIAALQLNH